MKLRGLFLFLISLLFLGGFAFQNCAKVNFTKNRETSSKDNSSIPINELETLDEVPRSSGNSNGDAYSGKVTRYIHWSQPGECGGRDIVEKDVILYDTIEYNLVKEDCNEITPLRLDESTIHQVDEDTLQFSDQEFTLILPSSCFEIFSIGGADGNGYYYIDVDGPGGDDSVSIYCDMDVVSGGWTPWSLWSECSASCDGGQQSRTRECRTNNCRGDSEEVQSCNEDPC